MDNTKEALDYLDSLFEKEREEKEQTTSEPPKEPETNIPNYAHIASPTRLKLNHYFVIYVPKANTYFGNKHEGKDVLALIHKDFDLIAESKNKDGKTIKHRLTPDSINEAVGGELHRADKHFHHVPEQYRRKVCIYGKIQRRFI